MKPSLIALLVLLAGCQLPQMAPNKQTKPPPLPKPPAMAVAKSLWEDPVITTNKPMVHLGWKPSPSANVSGYFMCWGLASGQTTNRLDTGNVTNVFLGKLMPGYRYYFTVVAYSSFGDEAPPSNEVNWTVDEMKRTIILTTLWSSNMVDWIEFKKETNTLQGDIGFWRLRIE